MWSLYICKTFDMLLTVNYVGRSSIMVYAMLLPNCCTLSLFFFFFFQAEDGIRDLYVTGVQTCALPILLKQERRSIARDCDERTGRLRTVDGRHAALQRNLRGCAWRVREIDESPRR